MVENPQPARAQPCAVQVSNDLPPWQDFLARRPDATLFHDPRWGQVMWQAYGNRPYYLTARRGETVVGVCQLVLQKSLLFGSHLTSVPYFDAAGVLADDPAAARDLVAEARSLLARLRVKWIELRQAQPLDESLPTQTDKVTFLLPVPDDPDDLWKSLDAKVRNQVRKAEKAHLTAHHGGADLLDEFYAVYARNMRDLGSPPHGRWFFQRILEAFPEAVRLFVVRQGGPAAAGAGGQTLAGSLTLTDRGAIHLPWASSDWRYRDLCPNMLLYWAMLKDACAQHLATFDFGRSTKDSGTYRFKKQWNARETPLYWQHLLPPGGSAPALRPDSPKYRLLVAAWQRLPVGVARLIGPRIIRKLA